jgi:hypothetical protein
MRKAIVISWFLLICTNIFTQDIDANENSHTYNYYSLLDSLLIVLGQQIKNDLQKEGFRTQVQKPGFGNSMLLETDFRSKSYILALAGTTKSKHEDFYKQGRGFRIGERLYEQALLDYAQENNKLPFEKLTFKFMNSRQDSLSNLAIYGEYSFKLNEDENFEIEKRKIEILRSKDEILRKYHSIF